MSGGVHFHSGAEDRAPGERRPRQLPGGIRQFVDREEELELLGTILPTSADGPLLASVYVIAGTAGAGKTSLALRWAHRVADRFPGGQLYVNLRGYDPGPPVTAHEALHRFLTALGVDARSIPDDVDAAAALYRSELADRRILVVLDNASSAAQVRPLLPGEGHSLAVVTSRSRLSGLAIRDGARRITLGTLPEPEAVALLRAIVAGYRSGDDADKLAELARLCAGLPLALRIAGERAATHPYLGLDDLIADLRDESALWDVLSAVDGGNEEEAEAVRTVFAWSYRALPAKAARVFRLLGLHPGPEIGLEAAAALAGQSPRATRQVLDVLVGAHLLEQTAPDRYEFHDLLRAYAADQAQREEASEGREGALRRVLDWYARGADAVQRRVSPAEARISPDPPDGESAAPSFPDHDAAVDWSEREYPNLLSAVRAAEKAGFDRLAWQLAAILHVARPPSAPRRMWLPAGETGLRAARRLGDRAAEAELLSCLGLIHRGLGHLEESGRCHEAALAIRRELGDRFNEARSLNHLGLVGLHRRRLTDARRRLAEAIEIFGTLGADHWEAITRSNLAQTLWESEELTAAAEQASRALAAHRALGNERAIGNVLRVRSDILRESGDADGALRAAGEAVRIAVHLRYRVAEAYWLITLGHAQRATGRAEESLESYQRSAALHRRLADPSREALAWQGAGEAYRELGRSEEAAAFLRRAATAHRDLGDAWHEALALDALATTLVEPHPETAHRRPRADLRRAGGQGRGARHPTGRAHPRRRWNALARC
ncbi:tetratricopeptide repeat protein [Streptomyces radicis]|uniref:Tetratricopeptide repeat protein n=1 Tax=Streptomyces radicis TaxID=1750517 RepID=A0A3A9VWY6_9ACTN|nr:tetratricopeptide repeat protein [Streptomyces radicis]RKN16793.1 tetratricopeptide repeat protein [Streptomyces radicis]